MHVLVRGLTRGLAVVVACAALTGTAVLASVAPVRAAPGDPDPNLLAYDPTIPLAVRTTRVPSAMSVRVDHLEYTTFDRTRVPALLVRPVPVPVDGACVLLQHGLGGRKEAIVEVFPELVAAGYTVLAIDAREHGDRNGFVFGSPAHDVDRLARMLRETAIDLRRAIDVLRRRPECSPTRIGYVGVSMGAMIGSLVGGVDHRLRVTALLLGGGDWQIHFESGAETFLSGVVRDPAALAAAHVALDPLDPARWVGGISPRRTLIVAARNDEVLVPAMADALIAATREPKTVVWVDSGHAVLGPGTDALHDALTEFLARRLAPPETSRRPSRPDERRGPMSNEAR